MAIFGHSKFIPVFFRKNCQKYSEWPFLAITNLCQSFLGKIIRKYSEWPFFPNLYQAILNLYQSFLGKIVGKNSEWPFLAIPNLYQFFWGKLMEKIQNGHFWPFQIYTSLFGKKCWKKFGTAIFGHSECFLTNFLYISL